MSVSQLADDIATLGIESKHVNVEISYEVVKLFPSVPISMRQNPRP